MAAVVEKTLAECQVSFARTSTNRRISPLYSVHLPLAAPNNSAIRCGIFRFSKEGISRRVARNVERRNQREANRFANIDFREKMLVEGPTISLPSFFAGIAAICKIGTISFPRFNPLLTTDNFKIADKPGTV